MVTAASTGLDWREVGQCVEVACAAECEVRLRKNVCAALLKLFEWNLKFGSVDKEFSGLQFSGVRADAFFLFVVCVLRVRRPTRGRESC